MTHVLPRLLTVTPAEAADTFVGAENGPADKRAYGGHLAAQAFAAAGQTLRPGLAPTSLHVQFLRGGDAGAPVHYEVQRVYDGRTTASRRVLARQDGRLLVTEKAGRLRIHSIDGATGTISGVPKVAYGGQGGLGDVILHPEFARNGLIYLSFVEAGKALGHKMRIAETALLSRKASSAPATSCWAGWSTAWAVPWTTRARSRATAKSRFTATSAILCAGARSANRWIWACVRSTPA